MTPGSPLYQALAHAVLVLHVSAVVFIVGGLILILLGGKLEWAWVRNFWFRLAHLAAIVFVAISSWLGIDCPLTTLELWLRSRAGLAGYFDDFIAHWLRKLVFFEAPPWVFATAYTAFALLALFSWTRVRPESPARFRRAL
jgi:hypothetical protein